MIIKTDKLIREDEYSHLLRNDLSIFIEKCFNDVSPGNKYLHNWHIDLIASYLEKCRRGGITRLIINMPPRYMKSICASVAFTAWLLGKDPASKIICASYGQELANKHARDTRSIMQSEWYLNLFPTRLSRDKLSVEEFMTTRGGTRLATSVGGVLTGRGGDFIIIDDPLKPIDAISDAQRNQVNQWYDGTVYSRLNNKNTGCIILIMQRLHEDDLSGHVQKHEGWVTLSLPAIAETDEIHNYHTSFGSHRHVRPVGSALHPEFESLEILAKQRLVLGEYNFAGQYQQQPAPMGGGMVKTAWFARYTEQLPQYERIIQSWDTANKTTDLSDYSVCTTWGIKDKKYYLLHVYREKVNFPDLKRAVINLANIHRAGSILIEDKASGTQLIQDLRYERINNIIAIKPDGDKIMRMHAQTAIIESGSVYIPQNAPWLTVFLHETSTFPAGKNDDQVDSMAQFLNWVAIANRYPLYRISSF